MDTKHPAECAHMHGQHWYLQCYAVPLEYAHISSPPIVFGIDQNLIREMVRLTRRDGWNMVFLLACSGDNLHCCILQTLLHCASQFTYVYSKSQPCRWKVATPFGRRRSPIARTQLIPRLGHRHVHRPLLPTNLFISLAKVEIALPASFLEELYS